MSLLTPHLGFFVWTLIAFIVCIPVIEEVCLEAHPEIIEGKGNRHC